MGAEVRCELWRHGFAPDGGGALRVWVSPRPLARYDILGRGRLLARRAVAKVAGVPRGIAEREIAVLTNRLGWGKVGLAADEVEALGPGNVIVVTLKFSDVTLVASELGNREIAAEIIARSLADRLDLFLPTDIPVDEHLADQIILPMALAGGGSFRTVELSAHARTQLGVLAAFLPELRIDVGPDGKGAWLVRIG
jgi:RNA 3'-terminal phosphate cyclase (ATP)